MSGHPGRGKGPAVGSRQLDLGRVLEILALTSHQALEVHEAKLQILEKFMKEREGLDFMC